MVIVGKPRFQQLIIERCTTFGFGHEITHGDLEKMGQTVEDVERHITLAILYIAHVTTVDVGCKGYSLLREPLPVAQPSQGIAQFLLDCHRLNV